MIIQESFMHLAPFVVEKLWGGHKLAPLKGLATNELVGETWEISTLKEGPSLYQGKPLFDCIPELKYLIKYIDTTDYLSVQVHPDDAYAHRVERSSGKTECWFILEAEKDAGIYLGFKPQVTKTQFEAAIVNKENLSQYLNFFPVVRGDFFYVPAGSVHAIGSGVTLAEVQQSSGITYRVWDWNRVDKNGLPRTLDVAKALDVLNFETSANQPAHFKYRRNVFAQTEHNFISHADFHVSVLHLKAGETSSMKLERNHTYSLLSLEGEAVVSLHDKKTAMKKYSSVLVNPSVQGELHFQANTACVFLVVR